jgi:hypothetical protein
MLRTALVLLALTLASPALAQATFTVGVGGGDGSSATLTVQQAPPGFAGDFAGAVVLSGVNIRSGPSSKAQIMGTLHAGGTVMARCQRGWCELQDGGYVGQKFLSFTATGSFDVAPTPPAGDVETATTDEAVISDSTTSLPPPGAAADAAVAANFAGAWTVTNDPSQKPVPLTFTQTGASVTGTMTGPARVTSITGDIQGSKLNFTYQMANAKGTAVASGNGYLTLGRDGQSLNGVLMLNGLVVSNINAVR